MKKKLVLFDIDGTLVRNNIGQTFSSERFENTLNEVFDIKTKIDFQRFEGTTDRYIFKTLLSEHGVSEKEFYKRFEEIADSFHKHVIKRTKEKHIYEQIVKAKELVHLLRKENHIKIGLMTGNIERCAWVKLDQGGYTKESFEFGVFGDTADNRIELAEQVHGKAKTHFQNTFASHEVVVIGDTVWDVRCGQVIGAKTIGVKTGNPGTHKDLDSSKADIVVESLMDEEVLRFLK